MSTVKTDSVIGSFLPIPVIEHATDSEVYTATAGQTVFVTTKFDRSNSIRVIAKSSGGVFSEVPATWTGVNTVTITGTILGAGQILYIFKVGTHASKIRVQDATGAWVDLSSYAAAKAGANSDITSLTGLTTPLSAAQGGTGSALGVMGRNRIINGCMRVAQRGAAAFSMGNAGYGGPDRYFAANSGAGGGFTQSTGTIGDNGVPKPAIFQTVNTATSSFTGTNSWSGIYQIVEGNNCFDMVGQPVSISFIFQTNVTGNFSVSLTDGGGVRSCVNQFAAVAGTPVKVSVNLPAIPLAIAASVPASNTGGLLLHVGALNTGTLQAPSLNSWVVGNYASAAGNVNWAATAGNYIALTELQLEVGTSATPFERRSMAHETTLCLRYYRAQQVTCSMYQVAGYGYGQYASHPVQMRVTPTVTWIPGTVNNTSTPGVSATTEGWIHSGYATATGAAFISGQALIHAEF